MLTDIIRKLTSRKLWLAIAGIAAGIAMALGASQSEIATVAGAVTALISVITYIITEGKIDAAAVKATIVAQGIVQAAGEEASVSEAG
jgi:hypothetical protein